MAYDEGLAQRLRDCFAERDDVVERRMFGGLAFMLSGNMCCGVIGDELMARVGPEYYASALQHAQARPMDFTGKPLKGFVYVASDGITADQGLERRVRRCIEFVDSLPAKS